MTIVKAKDLQKGQEFMYNGELHHVTVNEADPYNPLECKILTYVVSRPRTAPFVIWFHNNKEVEVNG